jgi:hypothetical protein
MARGGTYIDATFDEEAFEPLHTRFDQGNKVFLLEKG